MFPTNINIPVAMDIVSNEMDISTPLLSDDENEEKKEEWTDQLLPYTLYDKLSKKSPDDPMIWGTFDEQTDTRTTYKKVIDKIQSIYDARFIKTFSKKIQKQIIIEFILDYIQAGKIKQTNPVVSQLVYNFYQQDKPTAQYIDGPQVCKYYTYRNKQIYLFGELHGSTNLCNHFNKNSTSIIKYLTDLFNTTDVFIDFFLEISQHENIIDLIDFFSKNQVSVPQSNLLLSKIKSSFQTCLIPPNKMTNPEHPLVRCHYTDTRWQVPTIKGQNVFDEIDHSNFMAEKLKLQTNLNFTTVFGEIAYKYISNSKTMGQMKNKIIPIMNMAKNNWSNLCALYKNVIMKNPKIKKEYDKINNTDVKTAIDRLFTWHFNKNKPKMTALNLKSTGDQIYDAFIRFDLLAMDIYTISRIFRTFSIDKDTNQPRQVTNVIVYTGLWHMENYHKFLEYLGAVEVDSTSPVFNSQPHSGGIRCVDMTNIKQPLFQPF